jgi:hypothetical protein
MSTRDPNPIYTPYRPARVIPVAPPGMPTPLYGPLLLIAVSKIRAAEAEIAKRKKARPTARPVRD